MRKVTIVHTLQKGRHCVIQHSDSIVKLAQQTVLPVKLATIVKIPEVMFSCATRRVNILCINYAVQRFRSACAFA